MKKIVTFGEVMHRLSTENGERLAQAERLSIHYGGAEANTAISLANFGHDAYFISKVPDNSLGTAVDRKLKSYGVHTDYLLKGGERLGTYYLESGAGIRSAQVIYDRKYSSFSMLRMDEIDWDGVFLGADLFHVSGITPALSQNVKELTLQAMKIAKEYGVMISFDFNYRTKLWSQREAADTFKTLLPYVDISFCGELDAVHLLGISKGNFLSKEEKLKYFYLKIAEMYPNIKYMSCTFREILSWSTNRLQGNFFAEGELFQSEIFHLDQIVDRVGGGDAFAAGILHGILTNMPNSELVTFATAASALKHTVHGDCNVFTEEEVSVFAKNGSGKIVR